MSNRLPKSADEFAETWVLYNAPAPPSNAATPSAETEELRALSAQQIEQILAAHKPKK
jgi:hypothetical protein